MLEAVSATQIGMGGAILAVAYFVRGIAGFGSGLIAIPLLVHFMPLAVVVPLVVVLDYIASLMQGANNRADIRWREIVPLIPFSLIGVIIALLFLSRSDAMLLTKALGVFIILFALYMLSGYVPKTGAARGWGVLAGLTGGMIGTLFGTGGPFYVTYFKARGLDKSAFRATFAVVFLLDGAGRLTGYAATGLFKVGFLKMLALALPVMGVFLYLGGHVHTRLSQAAFQRGISLLLIGSGISLLAR